MTPPATNHIGDLTDALTAEMAIVLPQIAGGAGAIITAIVPVAVGILGMLAVVGIMTGSFKRMVGR
ncbi:MAG: hypothetical protein FWB96_00845 [Defluviitaleaceae bacterium]|nr:hypothetical protein [Defluviitaleaceae bacterium]MCL2262755.1 hypothetical protein [Defluviitaleaceae bacterium]